jgi:hypothetical protein
MSKIINITDEGFVSLEAFKDFLDISKVSYYDLKVTDGILVLKFYDKNRRLIRPYKENENDKD